MKHQIVNIRGCNGSGKTTIVRRFLDRLPREALGGKPSRPLGYRVDASSWGISLPIFVVGSYENTCGGTDGISTQEEIADRVVKAHRSGHVLVEGLLMSKSSAGGHVAPILKDHGAVFAFLDTPWDECLRRVLARREAAGNTKPFDPEKTMRSAYEQCHRSYELLSQVGGYDVRWLDWQNPISEVVGYIKAVENAD
jgi:thymidylate kinase